MTDEAIEEPEVAPEPEPQPTMFGVPMTESVGQLVLHPSVETYAATIEAMKADGFLSVIDLCGVDYLTNPQRSLPDGVAPERFEVVVNMISHKPPRRARPEPSKPFRHHVCDEHCVRLFVKIGENTDRAAAETVDSVRHLRVEEDDGELPVCFNPSCLIQSSSF